MLLQEPVAPATDHASGNASVKQDSNQPAVVAQKTPAGAAAKTEAESMENGGRTPRDQEHEKVVNTSPKSEGPPGVESPTSEKIPVAIEASPKGKAYSNRKSSKGQAITSVGSGVNHHRVQHLSQSMILFVDFCMWEIILFCNYRQRQTTRSES